MKPFSAPQNVGAHKILIIGAYGIGNALLFTPTLELLRLNFPKSHISVLTFLSGEREVFYRNPNVNTVFFCPTPKRFTLGEKLKFLWKLERVIENRRFDISITAFPANRRETNLIVLLTHARVRIGHRYLSGNARNLGFIHNIRIPISKYKHDVEQNLELLRPLGLNPSKARRKLVFPLTEDEYIWAEKFLRSHHFNPDELLIGLHPGSKAADAFKRWPQDKFQRLISELRRVYGAKAIVFGGPDETELARSIARESDPHALAVVNRRLGEVAALIEKCDLFIANDSGLMHLAVAVGTPTIGIFGPSDPIRVAPYGPHNLIIRKELKCSPCYHTFHNLGRSFKCIYSRQLCLERIRVEDVLEGVQNIIDSVPLKRRKFTV